MHRELWFQVERINSPKRDTPWVRQPVNGNFIKQSLHACKRPLTKVLRYVRSLVEHMSGCDSERTYHSSAMKHASLRLFSHSAKRAEMLCMEKSGFYPFTSRGKEKKNTQHKILCTRFLRFFSSSVCKIHACEWFDTWKSLLVKMKVFCWVEKTFFFCFAIQQTFHYHDEIITSEHFSSVE